MSETSSKRSRRTLWLLTLLVITVVGISLIRKPASQNTPGVAGPLPDGVLSYTSADPELPVAFQYPSGWRIDEERGAVDVYHQVRLRGPRNQEDTYTAYLLVRSTPLHERDAAEGVRGFMTRYTSHLPEGAAIDSRAAQQLAGLTAEDLMVSYTIPPLHRAGRAPRAIPVRTRTLVAAKDGRLYEFVYSADARAYTDSAGAFERVSRTLQIR